MPYFNAMGDDAQGPPAKLLTSGESERKINWNETAAKISIVVGMLTIFTMVTHTLKARK